MKEANDVFEIGIHIQECVDKLVHKAKDNNESYFVVFNGIRVEASPSSKAEDVVSKYLEDSKLARKEYENSEEYKIKERERKESVKKKQLELNNQVESLYKLEADNQKELLLWLSQVQELTDHVDVSVPVKEIIDEFENKGYHSGVNTGDDFDENDADNYARYVIGQAMENLESVGAIHPMIKTFSNAWIRIFS